MKSYWGRDFARLLGNAAQEPGFVAVRRVAQYIGALQSPLMDESGWPLSTLLTDDYGTNRRPAFSTCFIVSGGGANLGKQA